MSAREPECLLKLFNDKVSCLLKECDVLTVNVKYEGNSQYVNFEGETITAPKWLEKEIKKLENKERNYITSILARYYNTLQNDKLIILEKEIDKLEQQFYNRYAWKVQRDWLKERKRLT